MEELLEKQAAPWERREELGFFQSIGITIKEVLLSPDKFFVNYKKSENIGTPCIYFILITCVATFVAWIYGNLYRFMGPGQGTPIMLIILLFYNFVSIFIQTGLIYLFIKLFKGEGGYTETFHVYAYSIGSVSLFGIIPFLGGFIATVWGAVAAIFGLMKIHNLSGGKAALAYFLPGIILFGILFSLAMFAAVGMGVLQSMR